MAKKKKSVVAKQAKAPKEAPQVANDEAHAHNSPELDIVGRNANGFAFIGAALAVSLLIPAAELKLDSWSLAQMVLGYSELPSQITVAFRTPLTIVAAFAVMILAFLPLIEQKAGVRVATRFQRTYLMVFAILALLPAVHTFLFTQSDNVKQIKFVSGYYFYFLTLGSVFCYSTFLMYRRDEQMNHKTKPEELFQAAAFAVLLLITALINYQYVNYQLIPKATKILPTIMKK